MTDEDVIKRVATLFELSIVCRPANVERNWKASYLVVLRGERAVELMKVLRPMMGHRRQGQIDAALATWTEPRRRLTRKQGDEIVAALANGVSAIDLAQRYEISKWSVYAIKHGRYFAV